MTTETHGQSADTLALAGEIICAYVANNSIPAADLPALLGNIHAALQSISTGTATSASASVETAEQPTAAEIRKSVTRNGIISFIDGKAYKTLKRHLTGHGLDPHSYRKRFGLPADYPMTAASYSEARSQLAKDIGLGRPGRLAA